jgi:hypothetical protein
MGFLTGRMSFERFAIDGPKVRQFGEQHLEILKKFQIGKVESASTDEASVGFIAGQHVLDQRFSLEKNILNDVLHCGIRTDTNKIPAPLRKAWLEMELEAIAADNKSGRPTREQKKEAKEAVEARCEEEASSGKFRRMQYFNVLWDARDSVLYLGSSSSTAVSQCEAMFARGFDVSLQRTTAGRLAQQWAEAAKKPNLLDSVVPSVFHAQESETPIAWLPGGLGSCDFLGNEFLLWLWWTLETQSDEIKLADNSEVVGMLNRTLTLECPRGESGKETITSEAPVRLPEAMHAIRSGKLPRKTGLLLVRHGVQHEFVLQAETLGVSGAKIQLAESGNSADTGEDADRIEGLRHLAETIDLVYGTFCKVRLGKKWGDELEQIRRWISQVASGAKKSAA